MTTYLITGGAGFIGSNFIHFLEAKNDDTIRIINLDSLSYCGNRSNVSCYEGQDTYTFIHGDICDEALVGRLFKDNAIDYVVHFAAETHVDRSITSSREFVTTNVLGTVTLLNAALTSWSREDIESTKKRFLYVSTDEVYGELSAQGYFTEDMPLAPRNPYSASKAAADMMSHAYYETHQLPVLVTRCSNNYGSYQYEEKFIPLCIKHCLIGKEIPVYGDGLNIRDWLYVEDHCRAIDMVLTRGRVGEVYNIGGHNEHTNIEIVTTIQRILKEEFHLAVSPIRFVEDRKGHDRRYAINPAKIRNELSFEAGIRFEEGIRQTIRWYLEHQDFLNLSN